MKLLLLISLCLLGWLSDAYAQDPATDMAIAAKRFLQSLDPNAKAKAHFKFMDKERENWHFFPGEFIQPKGREGLSLKEMTAAQKILAHELLGSALSHRGLLEATDIILLEQILFEREGRAFRNPELYHISLFGTPDTLGTWGWRFEGHHLSLNFTLVNGRIFSNTPSFFGASPAKVFEGKYAGLQVLTDEAEQANKLFRSLSKTQKKLAILSEEAPRDILSGQDSTVNRKSFFPPNGLPITKLNPKQKNWLIELVHLYAVKHRPEVIKQISKRKPLVHPQETYIAWAGSLNLKKAHYYRVQTPDFLFEYANTQNDINHAHAVWRDFDGDFGRDLLSNHYQKEHMLDTGWESMFDGKTLNGWKANEDEDSFSVKDGSIVANAIGRCHLFYETKEPFKNFEFKTEVMTLPHSNAGVYFHTRFQEKGWPRAGFECQVNNTSHDPKKTASIYGVVDCLVAPARDNEWFNLYIKVDGSKILTKVNDTVISDWTQPSNWKKGAGFERTLSSGTFALQGHDPNSTVLFRNLMVKRLP